MKANRIWWSLLLSAIVTLLVSGLCFAILFWFGDAPLVSYRSVDCDVKILKNGDLRIVQHIDVMLRKRNKGSWHRIFQRYKLNPHNLTSISDISVTNVTDGQVYTEIPAHKQEPMEDSQWNSLYANHWYIGELDYFTSNLKPYTAADNESENHDTFKANTRLVEVGWNIPTVANTDSMKFDVAMTFHGVSTAYADAVKFQWEPVGTSNTVPIGKYHGTIHFPEGVASNKSWAWLHFTGASQARRLKDGTLSFSAYDIKPKQYLDVLVMFDSGTVQSVARQRPADKIKKLTIDSQTSRERQWNEKRYHKSLIQFTVLVLLLFLGMVLTAWGIVSVIVSNRAAKYRGDIEYWREAPGMSPASAASCISIVEDIGNLEQRQMAATVLSLVSKKAISMYPGSALQYRDIDLSHATNDAVVRSYQSNINTSGKKTNTLVIRTLCGVDRMSLQLTQSESSALDVLEKLAYYLGSPVFDCSQMQQAINRASHETQQDLSSAYQSFTDSANNEFSYLGLTRPEGGAALAIGLLEVILSIFAAAYGLLSHFVLMLPAAALILFMGLFLLFARKAVGITESGQTLVGQVLGLKRYLEDFSDFSDRTVDDMILWDQYLVYAVAMGISDKALRQMVQAYPQLRDPQWLDEYAGDSLLYWAYRPYSLWSYGMYNSSGEFVASSFDWSAADFGTQFTHSITDMQQMLVHISDDSSSFDSSGGSFSGGGFDGPDGGSGGGSFGAS